MITNLFLRLALVTLGTSLIVLGGCASTEPTRFYILHSIHGLESEKAAATNGDDIAIGIGPIELPEYLNRPQIVTRISKNELQLAEFDQWAEPLNYNFSSVLEENLSILLSTNRIFVYPWARSAQIDYQITVEVTRFDGVPGNDVSLNALWTILKEDEKRVLVKKKSSFSQPTGGQGYEDLVFAESQTLENLSREIAAAIKAIPQNMSAH